MGIAGGEKRKDLRKEEKEMEQTKDVAIQLQIIDRILKATEEQIRDYDFLFDCIAEYGIYPFPEIKKYYPDVRYTVNGIMQVPSEFVSFCLFVGSLTGITNALEVGVYRGRSSYLICALLYRKNKNLSYTMVDIVDALDGYEEFERLLPLEKKIPATSKDFKNQAFDFVFIDADHSYEGSMGDFINVGQYAKKVVCFHDIYDRKCIKRNGGPFRTWKEFSLLHHGFRTQTFSKFPMQLMGIGAGIRDERISYGEEEFGMLLERLQKEKEAFCRTVEEAGSVYIYGAEYNARRLSSLLENAGVEIRGFVVSDGQKKEAKVRRYPVYWLSETAAEGKDACFVLGLQDCFQEEVKKALSAYGCQNICGVSDDLFSALSIGHGEWEELV